LEPPPPQQPKTSGYLEKHDRTTQKHSPNKKRTETPAKKRSVNLSRPERTDCIRGCLSGSLKGTSKSSVRECEDIKHRLEQCEEQNKKLTEEIKQLRESKSMMAIKPPPPPPTEELPLSRPPLPFSMGDLLKANTKLKAAPKEEEKEEKEKEEEKEKNPLLAAITSGFPRLRKTPRKYEEPKEHNKTSPPQTDVKETLSNLFRGKFNLYPEEKIVKYYKGEDPPIETYTYKYVRVGEKNKYIRIKKEEKASDNQPLYYQYNADAKEPVGALRNKSGNINAYNEKLFTEIRDNNKIPKTVYTIDNVIYTETTEGSGEFTAEKKGKIQNTKIPGTFAIEKHTKKEQGKEVTTYSATEINPNQLGGKKCRKTYKNKFPFGNKMDRKTRNK